MIINRINVLKITIQFLSIFLVVNSSSYAQYYDIGQDPASMKWNQIKTKHFKIIFPKQNEKQAQYLANYIESIYEKSTKTLVSTPKNIPIILHTQSVVSNAYTIWAPKRMDFFTIPPQDTYGQEWLQQLAIHEFRHCIQINKIKQSKSKILYYLLGEQATAGILGLYIPAWFMEGDAVCTETALSKTGRGRLPSFEMEIKTQTLTKNKLSYDKALFGSYKDFVPNAYTLGYHLTAYARKKYNSNVWNNTLDFVAKHPLGITSFSRGIKKQTGLNKSQFYHQIINSLDTLWQQQQISINITNKTEISPKNKYYSNYNHPHYINDSIIVALKSNIDDITSVVKINKNNNETKLFSPAYYFPETLSINDSIMVWAEIKYDLRWENKNYSTIKSYNLKTRETKIVKNKSYLFSPSISNNGKIIVAVENNNKGESSFVFLESTNGAVLKKIEVPKNHSIITPSFNEDDNKLVFISVSDSGKGLYTYNIEKNNFSTIIPPNYEEISMPVFYKNFILFNASYSGIDNIYAIDTVSKQKYQITSSLYGAKNISISPNKQFISYSDYSSNGYKIVETNLDVNKWIKFDTIINTSIKLYESIVQQEINLSNDTIRLDSAYIIKKYSKFLHLFNFHSWAPLSIDAENTSISPGLSLFSQNILSTSFTSIGYKYDRQEKTENYYINYTYKGFYPIFDFKISKGDRASILTDKEKTRFTWNESKINSSIYIPFNISKGLFYRLIEPKINFSTTIIKHTPSTPKDFIKGTIQILEYSLFLYNQIKSVEMDMRPRWGQTIMLRYSHTPFKSINFGEIYAFNSSLNFPGIIKHHSTKLSIGFQKKNYGTYIYSDIINYPRGIKPITNEIMKTFSVDYKMPIAYPDLSIPNLIYIKRIKANIFLDYAFLLNKTISNTFNSIGIEATVDFHLFRFIVPIDAGIRFIYIPNNKHFTTEFLYQIKFDKL